MSTLPVPPPTQSLGYQLAVWIEWFLVHGPGDVQGEPIDLDHDWKVFLARAYGLEDDGRRRYTEAFLSRPKGCAKSELAGMLCCAEFVGPVRFDHWAAEGELSSWFIVDPDTREAIHYEYTQGEPVGRPVRSPFIRCLATEEEQTGNTYDNVSYMLERLSQGPYAAQFPRIDVGKGSQTSSRVFLEGGGEIRPSTAGAASKDGGKETFVVADETHLYTTDPLRRMFDTVQRNLGSKRKDSEPWMLQTSTMYGPGEDSIAERTHVAHEAGSLPGVLFDHTCGERVPLRHVRKLKEALRAAYVHRPWIDYDRIVSDAQDPRRDPAATYRYNLNLPTVPANAWMDAASWRARARPDISVGADTPIVLGFDGSVTDDHTALVGCTLDSGHLFLIDSWDPDDWDGEVPVEDVNDAVDWAFKTYNVVLMFGDPQYWRDWMGAWAQRHGTKVVREFWTQPSREMALAVEGLHTAVVTGQMTHEDHPLLNTDVLNARKRQTFAGILIRKETPKSRKKIDRAMAAILAYAARTFAIKAGLGRKRRRRMVIHK